MFGEGVSKDVGEGAENVGEDAENVGEDLV